MSFEIDRMEKTLKVIADLGDLTLIAGIDKERIPVHRAILNAQQCEYFDALLGPNFREGTKNEIVLEGFDGPTLKAVLQYIYTGYIELTEDNIESMLHIASSMQLVSLEQKCAQHLRTNRTLENCIDVLMLADKYNLMQLKADTLNFVCENFDDISMDDILQFDGNMFSELLKQQQFQVPETRIFDCLVEWTKKDDVNRATIVRELLMLISLDCLPTEFICTKVEPFFRKHGCIDAVLTEYRNRDCDPIPTHLCRCSKLKSKMNIYYAEITDTNQIKIYKYTFKWDEWRTFEYPTARSLANCGWIIHGSKFYIMGGKESNDYSDRVDCYDIATWNRITLPNMQQPRSNFKPIVFDNHIYVFGGITNDEDVQICERFDINGQRWETVHLTPSTINLSIECDAIEINGKIYIAGGYDEFSNRCLDVVYCFNPNNFECNEETRLDLSEFNTNILLTKSIKNLYVLDNGRTVHAYDTEKKVWLEIRQLDGTILKTIEYFGQKYALYRNNENVTKFGKINFGNEKILDELAVDAPFGANSTNGLFFVYETV